jgi:putative phosphoesterase
MPPVDVLVCAGDVIGYYPYSNEVCERIRGIEAAVVRGNHDAYVTGLLPPDPAKIGAYRTDWIRERLDESHLRWLKSLPIEMHFQWGPGRLCIRHASPWDEETYLYPDSPHLDRVRLQAGEILLLGHTHRPLVRACGDGLLVNPGSVGQPRDWNPMAAYALLDTETGSVTLRRVPYDVAGLQRELTQMNWEAGTIEILSRSRG